VTGTGHWSRSSGFSRSRFCTRLQRILWHDSAIRAGYWRGVARPNFSDLPPIFDITNAPKVSFGNPNLKPTHANNYDLLFEQYLKPLGVLQAGFFYKQLSDPIYESVSKVITPQVIQQNPLLAPYPNGTVSQPINGSGAHLYGFEIAYQQPLTFLPGLLSGFGLSANYGYTKSSTVGVPLRTDHPALQRQAPNTFNFSPTYDKGRLSARLGLSYNGPYIWSYVYQNLQADSTSPTGVSPSPCLWESKGLVETLICTSIPKWTRKPASACMAVYNLLLPG